MQRIIALYHVLEWRMMLDTCTIEPNKKYGERVRVAREARGWNKTKLAKRVGTHASTIVRIENAEQNPRADVMRRIREVLGVSYSEDTDIKRPKKLLLLEQIAALDDSEAEALFPQLESAITNGLAGLRGESLPSDAVESEDEDSDESSNQG